MSQLTRALAPDTREQIREETMTDTLAYADGYGRRHVLTRDTPMGLTRAIERMTAELMARAPRGQSEADMLDYVNRNIVSLPLSEWDSSPTFGGIPVPGGTWIHFAEYRID